MHLSYILYNHIRLHVSTFYFLIYHWLYLHMWSSIESLPSQNEKIKFPIDPLSQLWKNADSTKSGSQKRFETESKRVDKFPLMRR